MVVLAICASVILSAFIISIAINRGINMIEAKLTDIINEFSCIRASVLNIVLKKEIDNACLKVIADTLNSVKRILARNFRIAMNDEEFENL